MNQFKKAAALGVLISLASAGLAFGAEISTHGELEVRHVRQKINDVSNFENDAISNEYQLRYGFSSDVSDKATVKAGIISGTDAARNGYAGNDNNKKTDVLVDYAYVKYNTCDKSTLYLGKFHNNLFTASQILWDQDINPNGIGFNYAFSNGIGINLLYNTVTDQTGASDAMSEHSAIERTTIQATYDLNLFGYDINSGLSYTFSDDTFEYVALDLAVDLNMGLLSSVYGTAVNIQDSEDADASNAGLIGVVLGANDVMDGDWNVDINYRLLSSDSRLAAQTDDQFFNGQAGVEGYSVGLNYGLSDSTKLNLTYNTGKARTGSDVKAYAETRVGLTAQF